MQCPNCNSKSTQIKDSRLSPDGTMRRRRVRCSRGHTFSTVETYVTSDMWNVNKRSLDRLQITMQPLLDALSRLPIERIENGNLAISHTGGTDTHQIRGHEETHQSAK